MLGVGDWQVTAGSRSLDFALRAAGHGFGEEVLAPPLRTDLFTAGDGSLFEATVTLAGGTTFSGMGLFGLIGHTAPRPTVDVIDDAVRAASGAEVAVVVVGLTEEQETESVDKSTLYLPGRQNELVEAGGRRGPPYGGRRQRRHPGDHAVAGAGRRGCSGPACRARRAGTRWRPRCSATSSRPAGW